MISAKDLRSKMKSNSDSIVDNMLKSINSAVLNWADHGRFSGEIMLNKNQETYANLCVKRLQDLGYGAEYRSGGFLNFPRIEISW